jgi:hypothetical protein
LDVDEAIIGVWWWKARRVRSFNPESRARRRREGSDVGGWQVRASWDKAEPERVGWMMRQASLRDRPRHESVSFLRGGLGQLETGASRLGGDYRMKKNRPAGLFWLAFGLRVGEEKGGGERGRGPCGRVGWVVEQSARLAGGRERRQASLRQSGGNEGDETKQAKPRAR